MNYCKSPLSLITLLLILSISNVFASEKNILVIESYHAEYPWDASYLEALNDNLSEHNIVRFQMDTKRIPKTEFQAKADAAWNKYKEMKPDLVILGDDNAVKYLAPKLKETNTHVVFLGVNSNPRQLGIVGTNNITGILERPLFKRSIAELNSLFDDKLKKVLILFDSGTTSQAAVADAFKGKTTLKIGQIKAELRLNGNKNQWEKSVLNAKKEGFDAIIVGLYHTIIDAGGRHIPAGDILNWTSNNTPVPIFSFWDFAVGSNKTAGGLVLFGKVQGDEASKLVKAIFNGKSPGSIPPKIADRGRYLYSKTQLKKWGFKLTGRMKKRAEFVD